MLEWGWNAQADTIYATAKVGQQGDPIFADCRGRGRGRRGRRHGLEEWCDLSCKKVV